MTSVGRGISENGPNRLLGHRWRSESFDDFFDPLGANIGAQKLERDLSLEKDELTELEPVIRLLPKTFTSKEKHACSADNSLGLDHREQSPTLACNAASDGSLRKVQNVTKILNRHLQLACQRHEHLRRQSVTDVIDEVQIIVTICPHPRRGLKCSEDVLHSDSHEEPSFCKSGCRERTE